jgi:WD40 repeat protein
LASSLKPNVINKKPNTNMTNGINGEDNKVKLWNFNGQLLAELEHQNFVQCIEQIADNTIISASYDGTIRVWKI